LYQFSLVVDKELDQCLDNYMDWLPSTTTLHPNGGTSGGGLNIKSFAWTG